jgi:hypothetical protein
MLQDESDDPVGLGMLKMVPTRGLGSRGDPDQIQIVPMPLQSLLPEQGVFMRRHNDVILRDDV